MEIKIKNKKYTVIESNKAQEKLSLDLESRGFLPYTYIISSVKNAWYLAYQTKSGNFVIVV